MNENGNTGGRCPIHPECGVPCLRCEPTMAIRGLGSMAQVIEALRAAGYTVAPVEEVADANRR